MSVLMTPSFIPDNSLAAFDQAALKTSHKQVLDEAFVQFYLCVHSFGGQRQVDGVRSTLDGQEIEEDLVKPGTTELIPEEWAKPIKTASRRLRELVHRHCLSGDADRQYLVNVERSEDFFAQFNALVQEHDTAADKLAADYDTVKTLIRDRWRNRIPDDLTYEQRIGKLLPKTASALREKYSVEHRLISPQDAEKSTRLATGPVQQWFELAHQRALEQVAEQRRARYREPIERMRQGLLNLQLQVQSGQRISERTFTQFEDALVLFNICAEFISPSLVETVQQTAAMLATLREKASQAAQIRGRGQSFTGVIKAQQASLTSWISRVVADCEAAASAAGADDPLAVAPRKLRLHD